jgi:SAM-dependent methyltransferase
MNFPIKRLVDGRALLNIGCGRRANRSWTNVDFSPYARLAHHALAARLLHGTGLLSDLRYERLQQVDPEIVCWDLRRGIPYPTGTFDVVYHAHFLEHVPRDAARALLAECHRALRPGGILRVVVPDLQTLAAAYLNAAARLERGDHAAKDDHRHTIAEIFEPMVRTGSAGNIHRSRVLRFAERLIRGNADRTGELHCWIYDKHSLGNLLTGVGFTAVRTEEPVTSRIAGWKSFGLDADPDGRVDRPGSLYMEAVASMKHEA